MLTTVTAWSFDQIDERSSNAVSMDARVLADTETSPDL